MGLPTTQKQWVLNRLTAGAALTPFDAIAVGITRLGAVIFDLRKEGYSIVDANRKPEGGRYDRFSVYVLDRVSPREEGSHV